MDKDNSFNFMEVLKINRSNRSSHSTNSRNFSTLSYRIHGHSKFRFGANVYHVSPQNMLFIPPGISYSQTSSDEELIAVHFTSKYPIFQNASLITPQNTVKTKNLFVTLFDIYEKKEPQYMLMANSAFYELLYNIMLRSVPAPPEVIRPSLDYISKHYTNPSLSITEIASASHISEVYFRRLFRRQYSKTPIKYINEVRINRACALLKGNYMSLAEVAAASGFSSVKYFSKVFSDITKITPGKYASHRE